MMLRESWAEIDRLIKSKYMKYLSLEFFLNDLQLNDLMIFAWSREIMACYLMARVACMYPSVHQVQARRVAPR